MKKPFVAIMLSFAVAIGFVSCSEGEKSNDNEKSIEQEVKETEGTEETEPEVEESPLGNMAGLVGTWTADAATAGVEVTFKFGEDGSFTQDMGAVEGVGTWEVINDQRIRIVTQNTNSEGQECVINNLTANTFDLVWNPDAPNPKAIPLKRVN